MSKFYLYDGQNQIGPFDKSELIKKKISIETPIWYEGLADWTIAGEIIELKDLFVIKPPPFKKGESTLVTPKVIDTTNVERNPPLQKGNFIAKIINMKKFKLRLFQILVIVSIFLIGFYLITVYNRSIQESEQVAADLQRSEQEKQKIIEEQKRAQQENQSVAAAQNTPEKLRETLLEKEKNAPTDYLSATGTLEKYITRQPDLFHHTETDGYLLKGHITNIATISRYKDVVIIIHYYTKTRTLLDSKEFTIFEYFNPRSNTNFGPYKLYPPQGYEYWDMEIKGASSN